MLIAPSAHTKTLPLINDWCNFPLIFLQGVTELHCVCSAVRWWLVFMDFMSRERAVIFLLLILLHVRQRFAFVTWEFRVNGPVKPDYVYFSIILCVIQNDNVFIVVKAIGTPIAWTRGVQLLQCVLVLWEGVLQWITTGRNDFVCRSVMHVDNLSLSLNVVLWLASMLWSGWEVWSSIDLILMNIHLSHTTLGRAQLHPHNVTGLTDQFIESVDLDQ